MIRWQLPIAIQNCPAIRCARSYPCRLQGCPRSVADLDAPTERLTPVAWSDPHPAVRSPRDRLLDAYKAATPAARWLSMRLVARFATDPSGRMIRLADVGRGQAWRAHTAVRAAERLLRVPDGTVRAATAELRYTRLAAEDRQVADPS